MELDRAGPLGVSQLNQTDRAGIDQRGQASQLLIRRGTADRLPI